MSVSRNPSTLYFVTDSLCIFYMCHLPSCVVLASNHCHFIIFYGIFVGLYRG